MEWNHYSHTLKEHTEVGHATRGALAPYLAAAYTHDLGPEMTSTWALRRLRQGLLEEMAIHAETPQEIAATLALMDSCQRSRGDAGITARAGDVLIARAQHVPGTTPLPAGWEAPVEVMAASVMRHPSAAYWSRSVLRAVSPTVRKGIEPLGEEFRAPMKAKVVTLSAGGLE